MKINKLIILIILSFLISSCKSDIETQKKQQSYDIEILYKLKEKTRIRPNERLNDQYLYDGKLYLHFESYFKNDTVTVKVNGKFYKKMILNTNPALGYSGLMKFERIEEIKNVSLFINNGNEAFFEINKINHIAIDYGDSILTIRYLENVPYYD